MSDNTSDEEQQQQMEEIFICADIWLEIFALISPRELGLKVALISDRFDRLVDEHFKTRKWSLGTLQIRRAIDGKGAEIVASSGGRLPIPQGPLPGKVIGFEWIQIRYIDRGVLEFLQRLRRLFNSSGTTVAIATSADQSRSWDIIRQKIWPLINNNICHLRVCVASQLDCLRRDFPAILRNCTNLRSIDGLSHAFPAEDNANASSNQAVAKWLLTPRGDGLPKMLYYDGRMEELERALWNRITIEFNNMDIGDGMGDANDGRPKK
uniref:F-box domain-containing protein n=1 Tax=Globodera rostochiensis TaxID=31243 RepID=A0A914HG59_GLORO